MVKNISFYGLWGMGNREWGMGMVHLGMGILNLGGEVGKLVFQVFVDI